MEGGGIIPTLVSGRLVGRYMYVCPGSTLLANKTGEDGNSDLTLGGTYLG